MKVQTNASACKIDDTYALTITAENTQVSVATHCYNHINGNQTSVVIFDLSPEHILQIADAIRKVALDLKPELNESLTVGAGI